MTPAEIKSELKQLDTEIKRHYAAHPDDIDGREPLLMRVFDLRDRLGVRT